MKQKQKQKKKRVEGKPKGNAYERKVAKQLGNWMFENGSMLYKHEDSGARKTVYSGDVIPKDADNFPWNFWPFIIECKSGYKEHTPMLCGTQKLLREWLVKLLEERTYSQRIPLLIAQFHGRQPILLTNIILNMFSGISLALELGGNRYEIFYIYDFNKILKKDFNIIMPEWFNSVIDTPLTPRQKVGFKIPEAIPKVNTRLQEKREQIAEIIDEIINKQ